MLMRSKLHAMVTDRSYIGVRKTKQIQGTGTTSTTGATATPRKGIRGVRVPELKLERQVIAIFGRMKVEDLEVRDWFHLVLASQTRYAQRNSRAQREELTRQAFELSQTLREQWVTADYTTKQRLLETVCLNCRLDSAILCFQ